MVVLSSTIFWTERMTLLLATCSINSVFLLNLRIVESIVGRRSMDGRISSKMKFRCWHPVASSIGIFDEASLTEANTAGAALGVPKDEDEFRADYSGCVFKTSEDFRTGDVSSDSNAKYIP